MNPQLEKLKQELEKAKKLLEEVEQNIAEILKDYCPNCFPENGTLP
ncbi:MAG: hypothetical protein QXI58_00610 [Candidatus Micrarchaeia archaeon]